MDDDLPPGQSSLPEVAPARRLAPAAGFYGLTGTPVSLSVGDLTAVVDQLPAVSLGAS
jgi:hypothetical protein